MGHRGIKKAVFHFAWLFFIMLIGMQWAGVSWDGGWEFAPFIVSMVFLGLPHGAVDHLVPGRFKNKSRSLIGRSMALFVTGYVAIGGLYGFLWFIAPAASAVLFILLTWFHWGQGDLYTVQRWIGLQKRGFWRKVMLIFVRGGLPMLVPLFAFPDAYLTFVNAMISTIGSPSQGVIDPGALEILRLSLLIIFGAATIGYVLDGAIEGRGEWSKWAVDTAEIGLLWIFFYTVPPILAVGAYFCVWHAVRHIARLLITDPTMAERLASGRFWFAWGKFIRDSAPLTAVALLFLGGFYLFTIDGRSSLLDLTAIYLVLISLLTLPHTLLVCWMDNVERVW